MMLSPLSAFEFKRKNTFIHHLDPRTLLYFVILTSILILQFQQLIPVVIIFVAIIPLLFVARIIREWIVSLKGFIFLILIIFFINVFFSPANNPHPTTFALSMIFRLLALVTTFALFFQTVHPDDLGQALVKLRMPYEFSWAITTAYRYVPTLAKEAQQIIDAQMSRGIEFQKGNFLKRIRNYIPLIVPLFISAIKRAWKLAEAMDSKAWGAAKKRTFLYELQMSPMDYVIIIIITIVFISVIYVRYILGLPAWAEWTLPPELELKEIGKWILGYIVNFLQL
ncbi:MAG: energy-coupling factor transporter transmembrane protein EcfT [Candidatus Lokiarchaeota archaeon]|nr:energy-coupling factor transporter transmembrane protein EcfT [Candidatus Lokiarchaeota archaeon]